MHTLALVARPPRNAPAGGIFHITSRGNRRQPIFLDDRDRERFIELLAAVVKRFGWRCHAYCLMGNHYHLVIQTPKENLSQGMHRLNFLHAQWTNTRHDVDGHLFEGRFRSRIVESTYQLMTLTRYIALNPVAAGLCRKPGDWPWSSYRVAIGKVPRRRFLTLELLLGEFGNRAAEARDALRSFVESPLDSMGLRPRDGPAV